MSFIAIGVGVGGSVIGGVLAANSAEKQQNKALGFQQNAVGELEGLRAQQQNSPIMRILQQMVQSRVQNPHTLDGRTIELAKANYASDATQQYGNNVRGIGARYGATGAGRSGSARGAINRQGLQLGAGIAANNRNTDIQASQQNQRDEIAALQLAQQFFGLQQQPTRDVANAYSGTAALANTQQSPWAGFFNTLGQSFAGAGAAYAQNQDQQGQRAQQQANFNALLAQLGGGGGGGSGGGDFLGAWY